jgi:hypothetical protein
MMCGRGLVPSEGWEVERIYDNDSILFSFFTFYKNLMLWNMARRFPLISAKLFTGTCIMCTGIGTVFSIISVYESNKIPSLNWIFIRFTFSYNSQRRHTHLKRLQLDEFVSSL